MGNRLTRLDAASQRIVEIAVDFDLLLADGVITAAEQAAIADLVTDLKTQGLLVEDAALDLAVARQILTLGRDAVPNRPLARRLTDLEAALQRAEST